MSSETPVPVDAKKDAATVEGERLLGDFHRWLIANDMNICTQSFGEWRPVGVNVTEFLRTRFEQEERLRAASGCSCPTNWSPTVRMSIEPPHHTSCAKFRPGLDS